MIGIRNRRPGPRTRASAGLAEPEDDHLLVLLHDPDRQVQDQQDEDEDGHDDREQDGGFHADAPFEQRDQVAGPGSTGETIQDEAVLPDDPHPGTAREWAPVQAARGPLLADRVHGAERVDVGRHDGCLAGDPQAAHEHRAACIRRTRNAVTAISTPNRTVRPHHDDDHRPRDLHTRDRRVRPALPYRVPAPIATQAPARIVEQPVAGDLRLQREQDDPEAHEQEPRHVERQVREPDEREDEGQGPR